MTDEKDRFGDTMRLVERAREDIYFADRDQELLVKLREKVTRVEKTGNDLRCPKCPGLLGTYTLHGFVLDRCASCAESGWTKESRKGSFENSAGGR